MPIGLAPYPWSVLSDHHWEALYHASDELVGDVLDDLARLAQGTPFRHLTTAAYLPRRYLRRYDDAFLGKFLVSLVAVGMKLRLPGFHPLGCTGEELAVYAMKLRAGELLEERGETADFGAWDDVALEDTDHELLYSAALDGFEDTPQAQSMAMDHLPFGEWFVPFNPPRTVHSYLAAPEEVPWVADRALYPSAEQDIDEDIDEAGEEPLDGGDHESSTTTAAARRDL